MTEQADAPKFELPEGVTQFEFALHTMHLLSHAKPLMSEMQLLEWENVAALMKKLDSPEGELRCLAEQRETAAANGDEMSVEELRVGMLHFLDGVKLEVAEIEERLHRAGGMFEAQLLTVLALISS